MKPLFLLDFYISQNLLKKYRIIFTLFVIAFITSSLFLFTFFSTYSLYVLNAIPIALLFYDIKNKYIAALPYKKIHLVSEKYLLGLLTQGVTFLSFGILLVIRFLYRFVFAEFLFVLSILLFTIQIPVAVTLFVLFKCNNKTEPKTFIPILTYLLSAHLTDRLVAIISQTFRDYITGSYMRFPMFAIIILVPAAFYTLFWLLSIRTCKKRESK